MHRGRNARPGRPGEKLCLEYLVLLSKSRFCQMSKSRI
jgi:hypothetical protein